MKFEQKERKILKKLVIVLTVLVYGLLISSAAFAEETPKEKDHSHHHHKLIAPEKAKELKEKGYSKEDIFMAAILGKKSNKEIDDVLLIYKEKQSWEQTAAELKIDSEDFKQIESMIQWKKFVKENKEGVIEYLATYTNKDVSDIKGYMEDGNKLHYLIAAGALAKLSEQTLDEIVTTKKEGTCFHEQMKSLNIDKDALHQELEQFKTEAQRKVKETP